MNRNQFLRFAPPAAVIAFASAFLFLTYQLPEGARSAPLLVGWVTLPLALIDVASRLRSSTGELLMRTLNPAGLVSQEPSSQDIRESAKAMGMIVLLAAAFLLIGIVPAALIFIAGAYLMSGSSRLLAAGAAVGFTLLLWVTFAVMLRLILFPGLLFGGIV